MLELTGNVKLRYFAALDQFIRIRCFGTEEISHLVSGIEFKDRRAYVQFVINTTIVDYNDRLLPEILSGGLRTLHLGEFEEQLFKLCVDVNPALELEAVGRYMTSPDAAPLVFVEGKTARDRAPIFDREKLLSLESELSSRVIGQECAVHALADALRKAYVGFRDEEKPVGNFLFVGPTGVGKTELAKTLARHLFDEGPGLVRIDCSEFSQGHEYAKLIGSPPGYIGHGEGGQLTEALKKRSQVVVLFDEIEKADPKVHNLLLQILDDGLLTDGSGVRVSFRNAIIILTSNVGTREVAQLESRIGFNDEGPAHDDRAREGQRAVEKFFRPELLNRVDEVIFFRSFSGDDARRVVDVMLAEVARRLERHGLRVVFGDAAREFLVERGISNRYGARPLRRAIKRFVESPLAGHVLDGTFEGGTVEARVEGEALRFV